MLVDRWKLKYSLTRIRRFIIIYWKLNVNYQLRKELIILIIGKIKNGKWQDL